MYEDFYPYIAGSLDAKQRMRKVRLRRLYYTFGALVVFSSGFILGLAWYDLDSTHTQTALPSRPPIASAIPRPIETFTSPAELVDHHLTPQPIPPSEPAPHVVVETDAQTEAENIRTETSVPLPPPPVMPSPATTIPPLRPLDQVLVKKPVNVQPKAVPRPKIPRAPKQPPAPLKPYLVQIGAFRNEGNARSMVSKLRDKGYQPFIRTVKGRQNHILYRVFLDRAEDKTQAQAAAKAFEETEKMDTLVMLADNLSPVLPEHREVQSR